MSEPILRAPYIISDLPTHLPVLPGKEAFLECRFGGSPPLKTEWTKPGITPINDDHHNPNHNTTRMRVGQEGYYQVCISNQLGRLRSEQCTVTVKKSNDCDGCHLM
ncbi:uncharacterized protein LOC144442185 [Glandiceps talaboti]